MVDHGPRVLRVDAALVCLEAVGDCDTARNRAVLIDLGLHVVGALETVVVGNIVALPVLNSPAVVNATLSLSRGRAVAVSAHLDVRASPRIDVACLVLHAGGVGDTCVVGVIVDT